MYSNLSGCAAVATRTTEVVCDVRVDAARSCGGAELEAADVGVTGTHSTCRLVVDTDTCERDHDVKTNTK